MYSGSLLMPSMCEIMSSWNHVPTAQVTSSSINEKPLKGMDPNVETKKYPLKPHLDPDAGQCERGFCNYIPISIFFLVGALLQYLVFLVLIVIIFL